MDAAPTPYQLYSELRSLSKLIRDKVTIHYGAIEKILIMISEGGRDLLLADQEEFLKTDGFDDNNNTFSLLIETMNMKVPVEIIFEMIEVGGKELVMASGWDCTTPLHRAFESKSMFQIIPKLIEVGGRDLVMARSKLHHMTALHHACMYIPRLDKPKAKHDEAMATLIEFGGRELVMATDHNGNTVLHYATYHSISLENVKLMIAIGGRDLLEQTNHANMMAVYLVFSEGDIYMDVAQQILIELIKEGIIHNVGNDNEYSIGGLLHRNFSWEFLREWWEDVLLSVFTEINRLIQQSPKQTPTLLHFMIIIKFPNDMILDIIDSGDKELVMALDDNGNTALHYVCEEPMSLEIVKLMIDIGGNDLLEQTNYVHMKVVYSVLLDAELDENNMNTVIELIKQGIYHYDGNDEFSIGGLLPHNFSWEDFRECWDELLPVLIDVYWFMQREEPNKTPLLLHTMILSKAPKDMILDVLDNENFDSIVSMKDSLGRYAVHVAIEINLPFDQGMKEILQETIAMIGCDFLHGVAQDTRFRMLMTAAVGCDLNTIYSLISMDPMGILSSQY